MRRILKPVFASDVRFARVPDTQSTKNVDLESSVRAFSLVSMITAAHLSVASAQSKSVQQAVAGISEQDVRRRVHVIADDSMGGRDTPSRGLEATAKWIAEEFRRLGLKPWSGSQDFMQRYPISVLEQDHDSSFMHLSGPDGQSVHLRIGPDLTLRQGSPPPTLTDYDLVLIGGPPDTSGITPEAVAGKLVIWVGDWSKGAPTTPIAQAIMTKGARGMISLVNNDSITPPGAAGPPPIPIVRREDPRGTTPPVYLFIGRLNDKAITQSVPDAAETFAQLRGATTRVIQPVPEWKARIIRKMKTQQVQVPNVVGVLEGSDPALKNEYIVISAHMDHVGRRCDGTTPSDTVCNGADDDASGTVGVVELAEAFAQTNPRPKRSVVFLTVSGEEHGLWGSSHFAESTPGLAKVVVANLNMDMIGRNWRDSIVAIGKAHSDLGKTADRIAAAHPELGLTVADDLWPTEQLYFRSDHYNFARLGVPVLFFTSGLHPDYHAASDTPDKIDAEKEARLLRLVYYLTAEVANRAERPKWNPESYRAIVEGKR